MIISARIESGHLAGNLLHDPSERDLFIYLPPGYENSDRHYPAVYLLHSYGQTAEQLMKPRTTGQRWLPPIEDILNPVFGRMRAAPVIVIVPDGSTRYGCSQWVSSSVCGDFEQYVLGDIISYVDCHYRTIPEACSRGVLGFSSGGSGAWNLASRHPSVFSALAMLSGDTFLDMTHKTILYQYLNSIWPEQPNGPVADNGLAQVVYSYSAAYSPNPGKAPFYVDLPVASPSGELVQEVWDRWLSFDPVVNWRARKDNIRSLRGIMLDVGCRDDYQLQWGHRLLSHYLSGAAIAHETAEHAGNHGSRLPERYQVALQWLSQVLKHE